MRPRAQAVLLAALALAPALTGCLGLGAEVFVVASAPREANGLTVVVATGGLLGGPDEVRYHVKFKGETVYPSYGEGSPIEIVEGQGSAFLPYAKFVRGNGDYEVVVTGAGEDRNAHAHVAKWVRSVYLKPYMRGDILVIDSILQSSHGGQPQDRIVAQGELRLDIRYRGPDGSLNQTGHTLWTSTSDQRTFTRVRLVAEDMNHYKGQGWYSVHATFDNAEARGNSWVREDPTMDNRDPPVNWVYVE